MCVCADCCIYLLAYIRADEFKCLVAESTAIAAQRQSSCKQLLYGNVCRPSLHTAASASLDFPFFSRARRFQQRLACQSLCVSSSLCFTDSRVKHFHFPPKLWHKFSCCTVPFVVVSFACRCARLRSPLSTVNTRVSSSVCPRCKLCTYMI